MRIVGILFGLTTAFASMGAGPLAVGQDATIGIFSHHADVGAVKHAGSASYDSGAQVYELSGSGTNMWFAEDQFHFVWKKLSGDFILQAHAKLLGAGVDPHRKLGWMIRTSLDTDAAYVDVAVHGDGLTSIQFRRTKGAITEQVESTLKAPDVIHLMRKAGKFTMSVAKFGDSLTASELEGVDLGDEVYVGLFVCAHNADVLEQAIFNNVRIVLPAADDFRPYRDYIGSHLEVMELASGNRQILHSVEDSLQAPNWTPDDKSLLFNRNGSLYLYDLASGQVKQLPTGFADRNNNDHSLSFDGRQLGISHHFAEDAGRSNVFVLPAEGGTPKRLTKQGPSYLHGWSPDGKHLVYTAERNGDYDIFRIPSAGGDEVNLTNSKGLDDGSEYSPDGKHIYFNSSRSGSMQIWRMNADGSEQQQVTDDQFNNWFPHISPDGSSLVMLSFDPSVAPDDHPFYKHVTLRHIRIGDPQIKVVAYVYGGQGTINVASWSPDSKRIAFVSNSRLLDKSTIATDDSIGIGSSCKIEGRR